MRSYVKHTTIRSSQENAAQSSTEGDVCQTLSAAINNNNVWRENIKQMAVDDKPLMLIMLATCYVICSNSANEKNACVQLNSKSKETMDTAPEAEAYATACVLYCCIAIFRTMIVSSWTSALNAASPETQTWSQGFWASFSLQAVRLLVRQWQLQAQIQGLCRVPGSKLCQLQMQCLLPEQPLGESGLASMPATTHTKTVTRNWAEMQHLKCRKFARSNFTIRRHCSTAHTGMIRETVHFPLWIWDSLLCMWTNCQTNKQKVAFAAQIFALYTISTYDTAGTSVTSKKEQLDNQSSCRSFGSQGDLPWYRQRSCAHGYSCPRWPFCP